MRKRLIWDAILIIANDIASNDLNDIASNDLDDIVSPTNHSPTNTH